MKKFALVALLFAVTLALALWALGVFGRAKPAADEPATTATPPPSTSSGLAAAEPVEEQAPELPDLPTPVRVLVLGQEHRSFTAFLHMLWNLVPRIAWQTHYEVAASAGVTLHSEGLSALEARPTPSDVDAAQVLVLAAVDPKAYPDAFWDHVAGRVRAGTLGVLLLPDSTYGKAYGEIAALKDLLPLAPARVEPRVPGGSIAGVYPEAWPFEVEPAGVSHPASRMSPYPGWSRKLWDARREGKARWATKFVHPVGALAPGATRLVRVAVPDDAAGAPALVASDPKAGRVLWAGGYFDLGWKAYDDSQSFDAMKAHVVHWLVWLSTPQS